MSYKTVLDAYNAFAKAKKEFHSLTSEVYLQLANDIRDKWNIPDGSLLTYHTETEKHTNVIEDCVSLSEGIATFKIAIIIANEWAHFFQFEAWSTSEDQSLVIKMEYGEDSEEVEFDYPSISSPVRTLDFIPFYQVIDDYLVNFYKEAEYMYTM